MTRLVGSQDVLMTGHLRDDVDALSLFVIKLISRLAVRIIGTSTFEIIAVNGKEENDMAFNIKNDAKDEFMLMGKFRRKGYDWWWHSFTGRDAETGEEKPFFVEFYTINPGLGKDEPVFGQLPENKEKGIRPSYLMVKVGCWGSDARQLHRFFAWRDVQIKGSPLEVSAGDCRLTESSLKGTVSVSSEETAAHPEYMSDAGKMTFDLKIDKEIPFNVGYGTSTIMRKLKAFEMYWHVGGMKTRYSGTITLDGRTYTVSPETSYGYADKNWGCDFTSPWVWLASSHLYSNTKRKVLTNSAFDIGGGCPRVFGVPLRRKLLSAFWYEGEEFEFNFSKFWTLTRTKFDCTETEDEIIWKVQQESLKGCVKVLMRCRKSDMLLVNYEAPDGAKRFTRLWNGGNGVGRVHLYRRVGTRMQLVDDISVRNAGCEYGEFNEL